MKEPPGALADSWNPLAGEDPWAWDRLIESVGPASILVIISSRLGAVLRRRLTPEDVWQEVLLRTWRDRRHLEWQGLPAFRCWLLTITGHVIADLADEARAQKRGDGTQDRAFSELAASGSSAPGASCFAGPVASTTPSRAAMDREEARAMEDALAGRGRGPRLGRSVALKILRRPGAGQGSFERFQREARITALIDHPGICAVHVTGVLGGVPFIAMRHVEGLTLA